MFGRRKEKMLEGKAVIKETDMPAKMQKLAMASASQALDIYDVFDCTSIAAHIKKVTTLQHILQCVVYIECIYLLWVTWVCLELQEFDGLFGCGWQCVVGSNFGCFFTHSQGNFIYFTMETLNFLVFKASFSIPSSWCLRWERQAWDCHMGCHFIPFLYDRKNRCNASNKSFPLRVRLADFV